MRTLLILVFTALGLTAATPPSANLIKEDIAHLVDLFSDGIAVSCPECQKVHFGKIFGNNETDAVVLFSIEGFHGGNGHSEYLAFFEALRPEATSQRKSRPYRLVVVTQIGGRWWRTFDDKPIEIGTGFVKLAGKRWQPQDAGCCPSQSFTTTFKVTEGVIIEAP